MTTLIFEPSHTTHWKNLFPNKTLLLGSHNLNEGEELVAVINSVSIEPIKDQNGKEEHVPVLKFNNAPPMVLNITNTRTIASLYGPNYDNWQGKAIQIYATMVKAFGKNEMALRIREAIPETGEDVSQYEKSLRECKTIDELKAAYFAVPKHLQSKVSKIKDEMKGRVA